MARNTPAHGNLPARDRLLRTAHDLFYRDGIRATGIDRIIAEAEVTKVTFYRHFPSKDDLVAAFLELRHRDWIDWFSRAVRRHGGGLEALVPALSEWLTQDEFRGCAFINSVTEVGGTLPRAVEITNRHKREMTAIILSLLPLGPGSPNAEPIASAIALAVDGAIVRAQYEGTPQGALDALSTIIVAFERSIRCEFSNCWRLESGFR